MSEETWWASEASEQVFYRCALLVFHLTQRAAAACGRANDMLPETVAVFVKDAEPTACGCTNVVWHVIFCMYFMYVGMYVAYVSCIYMIICLFLQEQSLKLPATVGTAMSKLFRTKI